MSMLSTSVLSIKWTIKGKPKNIVGGLILGGDGDLTIRVNSQFTLNQISGQVTKHEEFWDLSASPVIAQSYFWTSRRLFATIESGKDLADAVKTLSSRFPTEKQDMDIFPDPSGDPTKVSHLVIKHSIYTQLCSVRTYVVSYYFFTDP